MCGTGRATYVRGAMHPLQMSSQICAFHGNRLEALKGDRRGQHSIRVNDQYRVCFRWTLAGAEDVEIVDYR